MRGLQGSHRVFVGLSFLFIFLFAISSLAAEKLKFGTGPKSSPIFYLPVGAAEEKGFWKQNGLEVEWVPFSAAATLHQAMAAGAINISASTVIGFIQAVASGLPNVIVSDLQSAELFILYVRTDSPIRRPEDLKGARIGIPRLRGPAEAYARVLGKLPGMGGEVKVVAVGGIPQLLAGLKTGIIDGVIEPAHLMVKPRLAGEIRELIYLKDSVPKDWVTHAVFARRDFTRKEPEVVKGAVRAIVQASNFLQENRGWAVEKIKSVSAFPEDAAKLILADYRFTQDGKLSRKGLENVRNFLIEFGIIAREKTPSAADMYVEGFTP